MPLLSFEELIFHFDHIFFSNLALSPWQSSAQGIQNETDLLPIIISAEWLPLVRSSAQVFQALSFAGSCFILFTLIIVNDSLAFAKIYDLELILLRLDFHHNIVWLEISVDVACLVNAVDTESHLDGKLLKGLIGETILSIHVDLLSEREVILAQYLNVVPTLSNILSSEVFTFVSPNFNIIYICNIA